MTTTMAQIHADKTGKVSDKWESYLTYYDQLFEPMRLASVSLLEIGVQNGGSLETWGQFFERGRFFVGCDIDPKCQALRFADARIKVVVGDINSQEVYDQVRSIASDYDIIVDDGSHASADVVFAFINYFPLVKPGGIYIVEDAHALYQPEYGGGVLSEISAYALFKRLVDTISFQFWSNEVSIETLLRTFFAPEAVPQFILEGWIESIEFRNSIITIRKSMVHGHEKLGARVIQGDVAQVDAEPLDLRGATESG